jgi:predicted O-methyltransferase YrrM
MMYALARFLRPRRCVELGVLHGFSLLCVAAALRDNGHGTIDGFDLFDDYPFRHESLVNAQAAIERCQLQGWARVQRADALDVHERFDRIDWLHVDISNDGDTYARVFEQWEARVEAVMILEGGSAARDEVEWMSAYAKRPIAPALDAIARSHRGWTFAVLAPFPSITVALRSSAIAVSP